MTSRSIVFLIVVTMVPFSALAADAPKTQSAAMCDMLAALVEPLAVDCGETSANERGSAERAPDLCAAKAFREKKAFVVTRKLAVSGTPDASIETIAGHSDGQVFRILYRPNVCDYGRTGQPGCGPSLHVTPCTPGPSPNAPRLTCSLPVAAPSAVKADRTSDDPTYGRTRENPVKIGSGPQAEKWFLWHLWDQDFKPLAYERLGSMKGADNHMIDQYVLTDSSGRESVLYIDSYHPDQPPIEFGKAPKGLYHWH